MKGVYTANIAINGVTEAVTLICLTAPANRVVEVLSASVTQTNGIAVTLGATLTRVGVLGSPDQTSITAHKHESGDQAAGSTVGGNITPGGDPTYVSEDYGLQGFHTLAGWFFDPVRDGQVFVAPGASIGLRLTIAPGSAMDTLAEITFREIG